MIKMEAKEELIKKNMKQVEVQEYSKYKKNIKFYYDLDVISEFRNKFPDQVEEMRRELLERFPRLKYNLGLLEKRINIEIFPSFLLQQDKYIFFDKIAKKTCGGTHVPIEQKEKGECETDSNRHDDIIYNNCKTLNEIHQNRNGGIKMLTADVVEAMLEELTMEENTMIKMAYGIEPYDDRKYTLKEIAEQADVSTVTASKYIKNIITKIKNKCVEQLVKENE